MEEKNPKTTAQNSPTQESPFRGYFETQLFLVLQKLLLFTAFFIFSRYNATHTNFKLTTFPKTYVFYVNNKNNPRLQPERSEGSRQRCRGPRLPGAVPELPPFPPAPERPQGERIPGRAGPQSRPRPLLTGVRGGARARGPGGAQRRRRCRAGGLCTIVLPCRGCGHGRTGSGARGRSPGSPGPDTRTGPGTGPRLRRRFRAANLTPHPPTVARGGQD